ncbi:50S ribosomal protein L23 [Patescibacteria group bacterium]|nr:50S ribosomal protein L23 [Patescibacteria group bacterium]MCG2694585.1 50S ribosomal protein L23 [Candidatus Parcubacteria bacterium]
MKTSDIKNNIGKSESILLNPRVTEKSSDKATENVYVFDVATSSNKVQIKKAIKDIYKVDAIKINVTQVPSKRVVSRGRRGVKKGGKKAFVYLKKGDKIEVN